MTITEIHEDLDTIEAIAAEFDIWREGDETDAELAHRTIVSLQDSVDELEAYIRRLRDLSPATPARADDSALIAGCSVPSQPPNP